MRELWITPSGSTRVWLSNTLSEEIWVYADRAGSQLIGKIFEGRTMRGMVCFSVQVEGCDRVVLSPKTEMKGAIVRLVERWRRHLRATA